MDLGDLAQLRIGNYASGIVFTGQAAQIWIQPNATAEKCTIMSGIILSVSAGTSITNAIVSSSGRINVYGTANFGTIYSGGQMRAYATGIINDMVVSSGGIIYVSSGGSVNEPIISSSGNLRVSSGATALLVTSETGASIVVYDGGYITYK